jgi:hypothetical protein
LVGDPSNPNGGLLERFDGATLSNGTTISDELNLPSVGISFDGATPANDFATTIYTLEYDGYADFPRYPINVLSDLNAFLGIYQVHGTYPLLTPAELATAIPLSTQGATETTYYMIPTTDLPLLDPLRSIPVIGNPLADLLQPDLTYIVNLGYGDPTFGWSTGPANIPTPFGLFPPLSDFEMLPGLLASGTETGIQNFIGDFTGTGPDPVTLSLGSLLGPSSGTASAFADPLAALSAAGSDPSLLLTNIVNTLSSDVSKAYSVLLPTADIINLLLTSMPAYDVSLFLDNLSNPIDAIGLPIAADTAILTLAGGFEFEVIAQAVSTILGSFGGLIP